MGLAIAIAGFGWGCGARTTGPRAQLFTLYDLDSAANAGRAVAMTPSLPTGFPGTKFITPGVDVDDQLAAGHGFVDGQPAVWVTTELWLNFDEVWAQPLYRATRGGVVIDGAPWLFGLGPRTSFYSPFWNTYGFEVPDGVDPSTILDTRAAVELGNRGGGFRSLGPRMTSEGPHRLIGSPDVAGTPYYDDLAAWDGSAGHRYFDFGPGGFTTGYGDVVGETPFFIFGSRGDGEAFQPLGFPGVAGTRALFAGAPALSAPATGDGAPAAVTGRPSFGGLWRVYWVAPFNPTMAADGRVTDCLPSGACVTLDSQTAIEGLGADRIFKSELSTATPILQLGDQTFPTGGGDLTRAR
ncbi:MAG TPA: hypothetical protein VGP07_02905 [Polyangia bacterium]|jgi:hypothetical protein